VPGPRLTVVGHLQELRRRLLIALVAWLTGCAAVWPFAPSLLDWLLSPLERPAVFLSPAEAFLVLFKLDLVVGAALASPIVLWQAAAFLLPALTKRERRAAIWAGAGGLVAFAVGVAFALEVLLPAMMRFFMGYATERLVPAISVDRYMNFLAWTALGCGVAFEFPVLAAGLSAAGILDGRTLLRHWRIAVVGCAIVAALVTPSPDAATMVIMMAPLLGLYFVGALAALATAPRARRHRW
jgi:sec-independent protein translocase protein TatC